LRWVDGFDVVLESADPRATTRLGELVATDKGCHSPPAQFPEHRESYLRCGGYLDAVLLAREP